MITYGRDFVRKGKGKIAEEFAFPENEYLGVWRISVRLSREIPC